MSRRGNNIYHRADGRWEGRHYFSGTHRYKSVYGRTYTEAKEKLVKLKNEAFVPSARCDLLFEDIMKMWLESRRLRLKESSYANYRNKLEKHIFPYFASAKYSSIGVEQIDKFISVKLKHDLSAKYISDMVVMIKSAAKWAEKSYGYADILHNSELPKIDEKKAVVFSHEEQQHLLFMIKNTKDLTSCGVLLTIFTGLRIGELCALTWEDIDFREKVLHIRRTLQRMSVFGKDKKTEVKLSAPKSATSIRDIPLPDFLLEELSEYRAAPEVYIVSGNTSCIEPRTFSNRYKALLKKANLPPLKFHCLRHTFATNALQHDFDIKTLSEILGHASANITMRVYIHSSMERKCACMSRLQELI